MTHVFWTQTASRDLDAIAEYIEKGSKYYAVLFVQQIRDASQTLGHFSKRGRVVPEIDDRSIRELFVMNYRLIYKIEGNTVVVVAVIHGSRDLGSLWKEEKRKT